MIGPVLKLFRFSFVRPLTTRNKILHNIATSARCKCHNADVCSVPHFTYFLFTTRKYGFESYSKWLPSILAKDTARSTITEQKLSETCAIKWWLNQQTLNSSIQRRSNEREQRGIEKKSASHSHPQGLHGGSKIVSRSNRTIRSPTGLYLTGQRILANLSKLRLA